MYLLLIIYLLGCWVVFWMQKTEVVAEGEVFTIGNMVIAVIASVFSWLTFLILVCRGWYMQIDATGYWKLPADGDNVIKKPIE